MEEKNIRQLIAEIRAGKVSEDQALARLRALPFIDLGHTKVDHHRALRQGAAEVIFAPGKTTRQIIAIMRELARAGGGVLVTRLDPQPARAVKKAFPKAIHNQIGRTVRLPAPTKAGAKKAAPPPGPEVLILSGGTADGPVVQEAAETLIWLGLTPRLVPDVGVAGIHRLFAHRELIEAARVLIVAAGMEGALASVVAGLVDKPVIGVPVSVGYGAGAGGLTPLLGMLNSCAAGVTVVNIDNGFGAAYAAARILKAVGP